MLRIHCMPQRSPIVPIETVLPNDCLLSVRMSTPANNHRQQSLQSGRVQKFTHLRQSCHADQ